MKIRPVGAELFHVERRTDERTDMTKLIVSFRNFAKALKNETLYKTLQNVRLSIEGNQNLNRFFPTTSVILLNGNDSLNFLN